MDRAANARPRRQRRKSRDDGRVKAHKGPAALDQVAQPDAVKEAPMLDDYDFQRVRARARNTRWVNVTPQQNDAARKRLRGGTGLWIDSVGRSERTLLSLWALIMLVALIWPGVQEFVPGTAERIKMRARTLAGVSPMNNASNIYTNFGQGSDFLTWSRVHTLQGLWWEVEVSRVANMSEFQDEVEGYGNLSRMLAYSIERPLSSISALMDVESSELRRHKARLNNKIQDEGHISLQLWSWIPWFGSSLSLSTLQTLQDIESLCDRVDIQLGGEIDRIQTHTNDMKDLSTRLMHLSHHTLVKISQLEPLGQDDRSIAEKWWQRDYEKERIRELLHHLQNYATFFGASRQPMDNLVDTLLDLREKSLEVKAAISEVPKPEFVLRETLVAQGDALDGIVNQMQMLHVLLRGIHKDWNSYSFVWS